MLAARADRMTVTGGALLRRFPATRALRRRLLVTCAALVLMALAAAGAPAPAAAGVGTRILTILKQEHCAGARTAVSVWTLGPAHSTYARNSRTALRPASNAKLVTATAALARWGPDHRFKTELYLPGIYASQTYNIGEVRGYVYLKGYGDPSLSMTRFQNDRLHVTTSSIEALVAHLKALGVTRIAGRIVGDASWFDAKQTVASWKAGLEDDCGPLSALSVNEGLRNGERVADPALYAARRLTRALEDAGIEVTRGALTGRVPQGAWLTATLVSAPLRTLLKPMLKQSDNFFAEMMVKGLGRDFAGEGSTLAGLTIVRRTLTDLGLDTTALRVADGSGLSYQNRFTTKGVARLLRVMAARDDFAVFRGGLAIAGRDGTLARRMRGTAAQGNFRGKTGYLRVASALSGYVTDAAGRRIVVSMLMNGDPVDYLHARRAQDRIVVYLARSSL